MRKRISRREVLAIAAFYILSCSILNLNGGNYDWRASGQAPNALLISNQDEPIIEDILSAEGYQFGKSDIIPPSLAEYNLVIATDIQNNIQAGLMTIKDYVANGGGFVYIGGAAFWSDLPSNADWLGASSVGFTGFGESAFVTEDNPLGTNLQTGDLLKQQAPDESGAQWVNDLQNGAQKLAEFNSTNVYAYSYSYASGRVFYQADTSPSLADQSAISNIQELLRAGIVWTTSAVEEEAPPEDILPAGTSITDGYSPFPEETHTFIFTEPGAQTIDVPAPSGDEANAIFVMVTSNVHNGILYFDSEGVQYQYAISPNSNFLLSFPQSLNISNVKLAIEDRDFPDDAGRVGYLVPEQPQQPSGPEEPSGPEQPSEPEPESTSLDADAGPNQTVEENLIVYLDGRGSSADRSTIRSYSWEQISGPTVVLDRANTVSPSFSAPSVSPAGSTLRFKLTVTDSDGNTSVDIVSITVRDIAESPMNRNPVVDAGVDLSVDESKTVYLLGSVYDADGNSLTYSWSQINGPVVILSGKASLNATFVSPQVLSSELLTFRLSVTDSRGGTAFDDISVTVVKKVTAIEIPNRPPIAYAGKNVVVDEGSIVTLSGSLSDPDGDAGIESQWNQVRGPGMSLSDPLSLSTTFLAPRLAQGQLVLVFELQARDSNNALAADRVTVIVRDVPIQLPEEKLLNIRTNDAFTSPPDQYALKFSAPGTLLADLPPTDNIVGIWADVPDVIAGTELKFTSMDFRYYFPLISGMAQGYLFEEPMSLTNATISINGLRASEATILLGYYTEEPVLTAITVERAGESDPIAVEPSQISTETLPPVQYAMQLVDSITPIIPLPFIIIIGVGIVVVIPASIAIAIQKSRRKNVLPKERRDAALAMAAMLFPNRDPIAEEEARKSPVIEALEKELGTTLNPAASVSDLLKKYTGESGTGIIEKS